MSKLNFEQKLDFEHNPNPSRDVGGPSGHVLLLVATALATWRLGHFLLHTLL